MEEDRYIRITLRLPRELHRRLDLEADKSSKSLNAEIVARLESTFGCDESFQMLYELRRTQLRLEQNKIESTRQGLIWEVRELNDLITQLEKKDLPEEAIEPHRSARLDKITQTEALRAQDLELTRQILALDDEHSDRFDLWEKE